MTARRATQASIKAKPTQPLEVPVREIDDTEALALGFHQMLIECEHGGICSGAGCGSDWLQVEWKGQRIAIRGLELLAAFVRTFDPEDADRILGAVVEGGIGVVAETREGD